MSQTSVRYLLKIDTTGLEEKFDLLRKALRSESLLAGIGEAHRQWIDENFESEGGKVGGWAPLAESTIAGRTEGPNKGAGQRILQDTGMLRASVTDPEIRGSTVYITVAKEYASYHDQGTDPYMIFPKGPYPLKFMGKDGKTVYAPWVHHPGLPRRQIVPNEEQSIEIAVQLIEAKVQQVVSGATLREVGRVGD